MSISIVIPTRGDVDLSPILATLPADAEVIVETGSGGVWHRYEAARRAKSEWIYTQDDDCLVDVDNVLLAAQPGVVVCNMPLRKRAEYPDRIALLGWGAVFHRSALDVFEGHLKRWPLDDLFRRECDRVFTKLNRVNLIDVPFAHLDHAHGRDRMGAQPEHLASLAEIRRRLNG